MRPAPQAEFRRLMRLRSQRRMVAYGRQTTCALGGLTSVQRIRGCGAQHYYYYYYFLPLCSGSRAVVAVRDRDRWHYFPFRQGRRCPSSEWRHRDPCPRSHPCRCRPRTTPRSLLLLLGRAAHGPRRRAACSPHAASNRSHVSYAVAPTPRPRQR